MLYLASSPSFHTSLSGSFFLWKASSDPTGLLHAVPLGGTHKGKAESSVAEIRLYPSHPSNALGQDTSWGDIMMMVSAQVGLHTWAVLE